MTILSTPPPVFDSKEKFGMQRWFQSLQKLFSDLNTTVSAISTIPSGSMLDYAGTSAPTGWLACDGTSYLRADYPDLFTAIGTTWGAADASHFNVPDFRRRTAVGSGGTGTATLANSVGSTGGSETHTLVTSEMPSHSHSYNPNSANSNGNPGGSTTWYWNQTSSNTGSAGGDQPHNNMQPSAVVLKIIKT